MAKKKEEEPKVPNDRLAKFLASELMGKIRKAHGDGVLLRASDFTVQQRPRIPTDIFAMDYALGGGIPVGMFSQIYGHKSAGKTTTVLRLIKNAQNMCAQCYRFLENEEWGCQCKTPRQFVCVYIDVEGALDIPWVRSLGVDTGKMIISVPEYAEQALDIAEAMLRSGDVDLVVLDSIAALTPMKEIEESVEKDMMGVGPRLIGKAFRKFQSAMNAVGAETDRRPTLIATNQIRMQLGVMFGNPETTPGGKAVGFAAATETRCAAGKYDMDDVSGQPVRVELRFKVEKNKTAGAKMEGSYFLHLTNGDKKRKGDVEDEDFMVVMGEKTGLVQRTRGYECLGKEFRIKQDLLDHLALDRPFRRRLYYDLLKVLLTDPEPAA